MRILFQILTIALILLVGQIPCVSAAFFISSSTRVLPTTIVSKTFRKRLATRMMDVDGCTPQEDTTIQSVNEKRIMKIMTTVDSANENDGTSQHDHTVTATSNNIQFTKHANDDDDHHHLEYLQSTRTILQCAAVVFTAMFVIPALLPDGGGGVFSAAAWAVDHPVDHVGLKIPNPLPDADPRYFISGGLCAAASHGITTPIDVVKTRMQAEPELFQTKGLISSTTSIIQQDGPQALLGGLGPTVVGYGLEGAVKFGLYESLKPQFALLLYGQDGGSSPAGAYLLASVVAGAVASLMLCPMEKTRIRLVTDPTFANGLISGLQRLLDEEGVFQILKGMPAMLSKQVPYTFSKQVSFDMFAGLLYTAAANANLAAVDVKYEVSIGAAFLASILSCISSHPGDVVLTATYKQGQSPTTTTAEPEEGMVVSATTTTARDGFTQVVADLYQTRGIGGFFTGLSARFFHVGAIITSQLVLYDIVKQLLGLPATGSH